MTRSIGLPRFHSRREGDGHVVYLLGTSTYLFAAPCAHDALLTLREGQDAARAAEVVAEGHALDAHVAQELVREAAAVLAGHLARTTYTVGGRSALCPLSDVVGPSAERCQTFGMPL